MKTDLVMAAMSKKKKKKPFAPKTKDLMDMPINSNWKSKGKVC